jgi:hypothetical protein
MRQAESVRTRGRVHGYIDLQEHVRAGPGRTLPNSLTLEFKVCGQVALFSSRQLLNVLTYGFLRACLKAV